jgi:uncharacterized membrane protein YciS (DUF1049 family)
LESQIFSYLLEQSLFVVGFALGGLGSFYYLRKVYADRIAALERQIRISDEKCEERINLFRKECERLQKRVDFLEDSRAFMLSKAIKDQNKD